MIRRITTVLMAPLLLVFGGCGDSANVGEPGEVSIVLTDAPGDVLQATVLIERVEILGDDGGAIVLRDTPVVTNLVDLANDATMLVNTVTVPAGHYTELRFIIPAGCIVVDGPGPDDEVYSSGGMDDCGPADGLLKMPSFAQSGLKVKLPDEGFEVDGDSTVVLVDFDVSESFGHEAGDSDSWVMHPVIHASLIEASGSITVDLSKAAPEITADPGDFQARLDTEAMAVPLGDLDADGTYSGTFRYLIPGVEYHVSVELRDGITYDYTVAPVPPQSVVLMDGEHATVAFQITSGGPPAP